MLDHTLASGQPLSLHSTGGAWGKMEEKLVLRQEHRLTSYFISTFTLEKNNPSWRLQVGTSNEPFFPFFKQRIRTNLNVAMIWKLLRRREGNITLELDFSLEALLRL